MKKILLSFVVTISIWFFLFSTSALAHVHDLSLPLDALIGSLEAGKTVPCIEPMIRDWKQTLKTWEETKEPLLLEFRACSEARDLEGMAGIYEELTAKYPCSLYAIVGLDYASDLYASIGKPDESIRVLNQGIELTIDLAKRCSKEHLHGQALDVRLCLLRSVSMLIDVRVEEATAEFAAESASSLKEADIDLWTFRKAPLIVARLFARSARSSKAKAVLNEARNGLLRYQESLGDEHERTWIKGRIKSCLKEIGDLLDELDSGKLGTREEIQGGK